MNEVEMLIEQREAVHAPANNSMRLYAYVRPFANGEAAVEVWGTQFHRRRKGSPRVCKKFFVFRTDRDTYKTRDTLQYSSWSRMVHDHICYSFPEAGGADCYATARSTVGGEWESLRGVWQKGRVSKTSDAHLPCYVSFLNGWEATKYRYSGYDARCGIFFMRYMALWGRFPKAEIISKMGCYQLLDEKFLARLDTDKPFAKYVYKYNDAIRRHAMSPADIYKAYKRGEDLTRYAQMLEAREAARQAAQAEKERKEYEKYDKAIAKLYEQLKDICGTYGAFEVVVPKNSYEMLKEGVAMHNCIGKCYAPRQGDTDICLFLHKDGKPCIDIRIELKTLKLVECREVCNKNANEAAWITANEIAEAVRTRLAA